jgi:cysteine-rich repeat protein
MKLWPALLLPVLALLLSACPGPGAACGDGITKAPDEACDDGNTTAGDGCRADCKGLEVCGDGLLDEASGEACDDGNTQGGDGGEFDAGEGCDDGNQDNTDFCTNVCLVAVCGDGFVQPGQGEECDDGNNTDGDGCESVCILP